MLARHCLVASGAFRAEGIDMAEDKSAGVPTEQVETPKKLSAAAQRALAEAEERRRAAQPPAAPPEFNGPKGPEPVRYGDWERKGIASDF
jgi:hypothetical protein